MPDKRRRHRVSGLELDTGKCVGSKSEDGKHRVWIGLTGDMLPFFCTNGCGCWSSERPPSITEEDMENL